MPARYAFFRKPTGEPYKGTDGKHAPFGLLAEIGKASEAHEGGGILWSDMDMWGIMPVLQSVLVIVGPDGEELNDLDSQQLSTQAFHAAAIESPGGPIKPDVFVKEADDIAAAFFRRPLVEYLLLGSLSVKALPASSIRIRECTISPTRGRGTRWPIPELLQRHSDARNFKEHLDGTRYQLVKVATKGRSIHEAASRAMDALQLLRGFWSLFLTFGARSFSMGMPKKKPLGVIHAGAVYTLHNLDRSIAEGSTYYYDPDLPEDQPLYRDQERLIRTDKQRRNAMKRLAALPYRSELESLLMRYASAMDHTSPEATFLQTWGILERITNTVGAKYDETIDRSVWLFKKARRPFAKDILETLRFHRNQYVHRGKSGLSADQIAYWMKSFVDPHLFKLIGNPFKIKRIEEYGEFLSMPTQVTHLERRIQDFQRALRIQKQAEATD